MKLSRPRHATISGFNMTPMIDIVFLLIIFFMTVSQISRALDHPVDLPKASQGGQSMESVNITINLDVDGNIIVANRQMSLEQLSAALTDELARVNQEPGRLRILVRCDRNSEGRHFNELVKRLETMGIRQIRVSINVQNDGR